MLRNQSLVKHVLDNERSGCSVAFAFLSRYSQLPYFEGCCLATGLIENITSQAAAPNQSQGS
jgi:hypothetical protein